MIVDYESIHLESGKKIIIRSIVGDINVVTLLGSWEEAIKAGIFDDAIAFISDTRDSKPFFSPNDFGIIKSFLEMHKDFFNTFKIAVLVDKEGLESKFKGQVPDLNISVFNNMQDALIWCKMVEA